MDSLQGLSLAGLSKTAQILFAAVPLVALAFLGVLAFFHLFWEHRRRMMIIEKGFSPPERDMRNRFLLIGLVCLFIGIGLILFQLLIGTIHEAALLGVVPACFGLAVLVFHLLVGGKTK
jgi:hypothetical protein